MLLFCSKQTAMRTDFYFKILSTAFAFSLLFFSVYHHSVLLADIFRSVSISILIVCFISIWMRTKKISQFLISLTLPIWLIFLTFPLPITNHIAFLDRVAQLEELAFLIKKEASYQRITIYTNSDPSVLSSSFSQPLFVPIVPLKDIPKQHFVIQLLNKSNANGFQLGHDCISFYFTNTRAIRYYYTKRRMYQGDKKIKGRWYWVNDKANQ